MQRTSDPIWIDPPDRPDPIHRPPIGRIGSVDRIGEMKKEKCLHCGGRVMAVEVLNGLEGIAVEFQCIACSRPLSRPATPVEDGLPRRTPKVQGQLI